MNALAILAAYFFGAIPFGYLIARSRGIDIFSSGSGNIGATNIGRVMGRKYGFFVFVLDFLKGAIPTWLVRNVQGPIDTLPLAVGLASILGHMFSVFLRFRGGKGVATGSGVISVLLPWETAGAVLIWLTILATTRYMSLASLIAGIALASLRILTTPNPFDSAERNLTLFAILVAGLIIMRHRANIGRLIHGEENRLNDSGTLSMAARVLHVFALAIWFGGGLFFTAISAPLAFSTFEGFVAAKPDWLPLPNDLSVEQSRRLAGAVVGPVFRPYFAISFACGLVALATSLAFLKREPGRKRHAARIAIIGAAFLGVVAGWPLVERVSQLRIARYGDPSLASAFGMWHGISLLLNCVVLGIVSFAVGLTACMPNDQATHSDSSISR